MEEVRTAVITGTDGAGTYAYKVEGDAGKGFTITNTHTLPDPAGQLYTITYVLNGGTFNGSTKDIVETYAARTGIAIHEAPVRSGYTFLYWKGSQYQPGDAYTVTESHTFTAQWQKNNTPDTDPDDPTKTSTDPDDPTKTSTDPDDPTKTSTTPDNPATPSDNPETPSTNPSGSSQPKTGDDSNVLLWSLVLLAAILGMTGSSVYLRKRRRR